MKFLVSQLLYFWQDRHSRINVLALSRFLALLGGMIVLYSVILTQLDAVTEALIARLRQVRQGYMLVVPELDEAQRLHDLGYQVVRGDVDSPQSYRNLRIEGASMVVTTANDRLSTNIAFTVRSVSATVPIVTTANAPTHPEVSTVISGATGVEQLAANAHGADWRLAAEELAEVNLLLDAQ